MKKVHKRKPKNSVLLTKEATERDNVVENVPKRC